MPAFEQSYLVQTGQSYFARNTYLTEFHFESVVFNDSMTVDSIVDVESALSGKL